MTPHPTTPAPLSADEMAELQAQYERATPGEWRCDGTLYSGNQFKYYEIGSQRRMFWVAKVLAFDDGLIDGADPQYKANAACIVALHNAFPRLLATVAEAHERAEARSRTDREVAENYLGHCEAACGQVDSLEAERDALAAHVERAEKELAGWRHEREMTLTAFAHVRDGGDSALIGHPNGSNFGDAFRAALDRVQAEALRDWANGIDSINSPSADFIKRKMLEKADCLEAASGKW